MNNFNNMILITKEKINFLKSLPEYADSRLAQINSKIDNSQDLELHTILQIGIAMNIYFKSLIKSLETKNIIAANILLRSIVESFINIEYIMKEDQQKRSAIFSLEDFKNRKINLETIKELLRAKLNDARITLELSSKKKCNEQLKKIKSEEDNILSILKNDYRIVIEESEKRIPSVEQRAINAGLKNIYDILYRQLCWTTHLNSTGLKQLIKYENDKYIIAPQDIEEETKKIIPIAYSIQLKTIEDIMKKFNLYIEEDFKAMENILKKLQI